MENYYKAQGLWGIPTDRDALEFSQIVDLDISTVKPGVAGPKRPQDRIVLSQAKQQVEKDLTNYADVDHDLVDLEGAESFPASDPPGNSPEEEYSHHQHHHRHEKRFHQMYRHRRHHRRPSIQQ